LSIKHFSIDASISGRFFRLLSNNARKSADGLKNKSTILFEKKFLHYFPTLVD
jgi:hypothetical protein